MVLGRIADGVAWGMDTVSSTVSEALFEPVVRLGVTGLSRAGKTVFITSLVANLMDRGRMPQLRAASSGTIQAAWLQPQPDVTLPRFDYEAHLAALSGPDPQWPESTRAISELRLSLRLQPTGLMGRMGGPRTLHLDIVDYPGEWLLDLALLDKSFAQWSAETLARLHNRPEAAAYLAAVSETDPGGTHDEATARALAHGFTEYLTAARAAGWSDCTPGRFLLPGDLAGAPVLTFAPLPEPARARASIWRASLWREMEKRFEGYKRAVVRPFFHDHFARLDRQVVLADVLGAIHAGPRAVEDMRRTLAEILGAFRPGRNAFLTRLWAGRRVERILFAATKADHLHHSQHERLGAIMSALLREARDRASFAGARTEALSLASLRTTVEETRTHWGRPVDCVRGRLQRTGKQAAFHAGELPDDPAALLVPAREGAARWLEGDYGMMAFAPAPLSLRPGEGPPHIRLDRAAEFLIGDRLLRG